MRTQPWAMPKRLATAAALVLVSGTLLAPAAQATSGDAGITVRDGVCDFAAADLGHGTAADPFIINTPKQMAEVDDCSNIQATITGVSGNGTLETFTAANTFGAGQTISISGMDPSGYNTTEVVKVVSASATQFTVSGTETGTFVSGGTATAVHHFYELNADLDLSTGSTDWNDTRSANITAVSGDGTTVTFTAANSFTAGQTVNIRGISGYSAEQVGDVTVADANSTSFTVSASATTMTATNAVAYAPGWKPIGLSTTFEGTFDGNGHTIDGLTIHRNANYDGLFGRVANSSIGNITFTDVNVDQTGPTSVEFSAALVARANSTVLRNISVSGHLSASRNYGGLVVGNLQSGAMRDLEVSGTIDVYTGHQDQSTWIGGAIGFSQYASLVNATSSVDIDTTNQRMDQSLTPYYGVKIGGIAGQIREAGEITNVHSSGDIVGSRIEVGGIAGLAYNAVVRNATSSSNISLVTSATYVPANNTNDWVGNIARIGSLFGEFDDGSVYDSSATGDILVDTTLRVSVSGIKNIGGLMGSYGCCGEVTRSYSTGDVTIRGAFDLVDGIGGLFGSDGCCDANSELYSTGDVSVIHSGGGETRNIGGLVGAYWCCGTYRDSHSTGSVTVDTSSGTSVPKQIGGYMGFFDCCGGVSDSYSTGDVSVTAPAGHAGKDIGGFIGLAAYGSGFSGNHSTGSVTVVNGQNAGGLIGHTHEGNAISTSYSTGEVTASFDGDVNAGGLVGYQEYELTVDRSYSTSNVTATSVTDGQNANYAGGLIGKSAGILKVSDSYTRSNVSASSKVAGLIGSIANTGTTILNTYAAGTLTATGTNGVKDAFANGQWTDATGSNVYDSTLAATTSLDNVLAKTTAQMKDKGTFTALDWKFDTTNPWLISSSVNGGYPSLNLAATEDESTPSTPTGGVVKSKDLGKVYFANNSTKLTKKGKAALTKMAKTIKAKKYTRVLVMGYAAKGGKSDSLVLSQYNLSWKRAQVTSSYLAKALKKINAQKVKFTNAGAGAHNPVATNKTKKGRALNRRAEITAFG